MARADAWKPDWAAGQPESTVPGWRQGRSGATKSRGSGRWRFGLAWAAFLAVCAGFVWLTTWVRPPQPGRLVLFGASYETNLLVADNVAGVGGLKHLFAATEDGSQLLKAPGGVVELRSDIAWEPALERIKDAMLVVAVSAHGGRDAHGSYLLPHDTDLRDTSRQRIRISDLIDEIGKLPPGQKKLLVLDAVFMPSHAALGMLHNDFARGLIELESRILAVPNLVVICSTSPDELSADSPEWGTTAFGRFFLDGLRGLGDLDGDRRVDAHELWQYTRDNVSRWSRINRLADQTPMLLPRGPEGERRARHLLLSLADRSYEPPPPAEVSDPSPHLKSTWEKWASLRDVAPSPAVFAPHRWQQYQAGVLRVERLLRFGDVDGARRVQATLDRWEQEFRKDRELPAPSLTRAWAMSRSEADVVIDEATQKHFDALWDAPNEDEAQAVWNEWVKLGMKDPATGPPRRELVRLVYERLTQNPGDLERAGQRLRLIRDGSSPMPPEPHLALMLSRDLPANPPAIEYASTLPLALDVRRLAERIPLAADKTTYSYAERLMPWIAAGWLEVDREREHAQDLLLSGSADDWKRGRDQLRKAESGYRNLQEDAALVRRSFAVRDRVQAMLPFYATWSLKKATTDVELDRDILRIQQDARTLDDALAKRFDEIELRHAKHAQQVRATRTVEVDVARHVLRDCEAVLSVPFADRLDLVRHQATLSRLVLVDGQPLTPPTLPMTASQTAQAWGKRFGALTLARFGPQWFDRWAAPGAETYAQVEHRLGIFGVEEKWWESAAFAGDQIGQRLARMNEDVRRLTTLDPKATLADSRAALQEADRIVRAADSRIPIKADAAGMFRRWLTAEFLERMARRTWHDHWFDDNPAAEPYFRTICRGYLLDAQNLAASFGHPASWKQSFQAWDARLQAPGELVLVDTTGRKTDASGRLVASDDRFAILTSETALQREYRLAPSRADDPTPGGSPVVWVESFKGLVPLEPKERQRVVLAVDPDRKRLDDATPLVCSFTSPLIAEAEEKNLMAPVQRTSLLFKGLFRGQPIKLETRVEIQATPDVVVRQLPMPNLSTVAVRTRRETHSRVGSAQGGIAFVLDASGSMRPRDENVPEKSRYHEAILALRAVLQKLPKDTQVSVWTFGSALGPDKSADRAEETILAVLPPTPWDPANPKMLEGLMAQLAYPVVEPWNESPIARSLMKARGDLAGVVGYKAIVAITDGGDNRFAKDPALVSQHKNLTGFLRNTFDKSDVAIHVLTFPPANLEERDARKELLTIESIEPPGKVFLVSETDKLIDIFDKMLKQRLNYFVDYQGRNVTVDDVPEKGLDISPGDANYRWIGKGLKPGGHKLRVDVAGRVEKSILLHPGDLLLADLVDGPGGLTFERFLFSSEFPWKRSQENGKRDWKMSVLQNQLDANKGLEMLVTLEKTVDKRENLLEQIRPRDAWVEVGLAADPTATPPVRWSYLAGYPAPAWAIQSPGWASAGTAAAPMVRMWWNPDEPARSAADLVLGDVFRERDRPVFLPQEPPVTLESVQIERHFVETRPGVLAPRTCLVVRIRHAAGRPVIARLHGLDPAGSEQRLYNQNDKTASLFWFEPDLDAKASFAELARARVRLISIAAFKEEARQRDYFLEIRDLNPPDPADERPRPPIELKGR